MNRSILVYFDTQEKTVKPWYFDEINPNTAIGTIVSNLAKANNAMKQVENLPELTSDISKYDIYDWGLREIDIGIPIRRVRKPGIVIAVLKDNDDPKSRAISIKSYVEMMAHKDDIQLELLYSFLYGYRGEFEPCFHEIMISYVPQDYSAANEIASFFLDKGIISFMVQGTIRTSKSWQEDLRKAIKNVKAAVIVISDTSLSDNWVMCQIGALGALEKPIYLAVLQIETGKFPYILNKYISMNAQTSQQRKILCETIITSCNLGVIFDNA